jgi:Tfp pilus assembly protein PilO
MAYRISNRERYLLYATIAIIGGFLLYWWVLRPAIAKSHALSQQIQLKKRVVENCLHLLNDRQDILGEAGKFAKYERAGLSEEEETANFLRQIEEIAKKSSVQMVDLKPYSAKKTESYVEYRVELEVESPISQLMTFIYNLQSSDGLIRTSKFRINPKEGNPSIMKGYLTITKVSLP